MASIELDRHRVGAVLARHLIDDPPPLRTVRPDVPLPSARYSSSDLGPRFANGRTAIDFPVITEEIISALAKIQGLRVVSRTSVFAPKGQSLDVRTLGEQLHVSTVLEGGIHREGDKLRVTAQLVNVQEGYSRWSEKYDREMKEVLVIQDEIARNIASSLQIILTEDESRALRRSPPGNIEAYEFYLRGRQFFHQTRKKSLQFAQQMFGRAIEIDSDYALAHAGVADCCSMLDMYYPGVGDLDRADAASCKALEIAPDLAETHAARGFALWRLGRNGESEHEFQTAMRLDPNQFEARYFFARERFEEGKIEAAAKLFEEALRVREDYQAAFFAAQCCAALKRTVDTATAYRQALHITARHLDLNPDDPLAATMRAVSLCRLGHKEAGKEWAERALAIDPEDAGVRYNVACLYALEGHLDEAVDCLQDAVDVGFAAKKWIQRDPDLEPLHGHPRFQNLLSSM